MKFGINTFLWTANFDKEHIDLFPRIKEWGFDGVEIGCFNFREFPARDVRRALESNGLGATVCSALIGSQSLATDDSTIRKQTSEHIRDGIRMVGEIGASTFAGPFCSAVGYLPGRRRTDEEWQRAIDGIRELTPALDDAKVTLAVEPLNRFETFFLNTQADARSLCDAVNHPRVGVLFDTFHANIEEKSMAAGCEALGPYIKHVHTCENDRGTPGSGHIEWTEVFSSLKKAGYDDWLVIETFGSRIKEIAAAACIWRDLAPVSEDIASEGVKFLKLQARLAAAG